MSGTLPQTFHKCSWNGRSELVVVDKNVFGKISTGEKTRSGQRNSMPVVDAGL